MLARKPPPSFAILLLALLLALGLASCRGDDGSPGNSGDSDTDGSTDALLDESTEPDADSQEDADSQDAAANEGTCGSGTYGWRGLIPGPASPDFDAALEAKATGFERQFRLWSARAMGLNTDVSIALSQAEDRAQIEAFLRDESGYDFEAWAGRDPLELVTAQHKVAGLYAGVGAAADAYRYMVLRDQGYPCADVAFAEEALHRTLDALHVPVVITGAEGVIARGLARRDLPGGGSHYETVPLFNEEGMPLPLEKNNGTWREDFSASGDYPNLIWEDSVSRDQYVGWVAAYAAAWEAIRDDEAFTDEERARLRADALAVGRQLMVVRESGYDLELPDADGRTTLHGWLNEQNIDGKLYVAGFENGFHAIMALGIVAAWVYVTEDAELEAWLVDELIGERDLPGIVERKVSQFVDAGVLSNYSNYNMAFTGAWLATRYLKDEAALATLRAALADEMYDRPGKDRQPADIAYSLYDFVYAGGVAGQSAWHDMFEAPDEGAVARGLQSLSSYDEAPYWDVQVELCPGWTCTKEEQIEGDPHCEANDGTAWTALGCVGRNNDLVTEAPIPMAYLPPSNYHWRSNPFKPNGGGDGSRLLPAVDFRFAYWMGRVMRR